MLVISSVCFCLFVLPIKNVSLEAWSFFSNLVERGLLLLQHKLKSWGHDRGTRWTITSWASCTGTAPPVKAKLSKSQFMLARTKNVINPKIQTTKSKSKTENSFPNSFWCTCNWSVSDSSNSKKAAARLRIQQDASPLNKFALKLRINFQEETPKWCTLKYTTFPFLYFLLPNPKAKLNPSKSPQPPTKGGYIQPHTGSWWPWVDSFQ